MRTRIAISSLVIAFCCAGAAPADTGPRVTFTKWTVQIVSAGVTANDTDLPGQAQPTCEDDELQFAGITGRYRGFVPGTVVRGRFFFDGKNVATVGPYSTHKHATFGLTWKPGGPVAIGGTHVIELRFVADGKVIARARQRFTPGGADDCR